MQSSIHILVLDRNSTFADLLRTELQMQRATFRLRQVATEAQFREQLLAEAPGLILAVHALPDCDGMAALGLARQLCSQVPFIFVCGAHEEETAMAALRLGAIDYVLRGRFDRLGFVLRRALREVADRHHSKQAGLALEEMEERYRALFDRSLDCLYVHDLEGRFIDANPAALVMLGYTREEIPSVTFDALLSPDQLPLARHCLEEVTRTGTQQEAAEFALRHKQGARVMVEIKASLILRQGRPYAVQGIARDITARKKLETQLLRSQRMESIGALAGGMAHDLNNVLAPIMMSCQLLAAQTAEAEDKQLIDIISRSARRGADLVSQVLSFCRGMEGRRMELQPQALVEEVNNIVRETFPKSIQVQTRLGADLWPITANPTQIHQVLLNLCVNARDAMPNGGVLRLEAENTLAEPPPGWTGAPEARPHLMITVADTGTGIAPGLLQKIFDPFFTTKDVGKGTGLGLSTSLGIVKSHGGYMDVSSEAGQGAVFKVFIPALAAKRPPDAEDCPSQLPRGNGELVLLVDDEAAVRTITSQTLQAYGYNVIAACDGAQAVDLYQQHAAEVAVILLDMLMPVMDGPTTLEVLGRSHKKLRVIAVSGFSPEGAKFGAPGDGEVVNAFLPKPYTAETLLRILHEVLRGPDKGSSSAIAVTS
jgi:PAS domain S-box-containing protein